MSSWTYLIAETPDPVAFIEAIEEVLQPYANTVEEQEPLADSPTRVRLWLGNRLRAPDDIEEADRDATSREPPTAGERLREFLPAVIAEGPLKPYLPGPNGEGREPPEGGDRMAEFLQYVLTDGAIRPYDWALVVRGNDTADTASVEIYRDDEQIDAYHGQQGRLGEDVGAYLERYHDVLIDPRPRNTGWRDSTYDPTYDLKGQEPGETLAQSEPSSPFTYGSEDTWFRVVAETEEADRFEDMLREYPVPVERREPRGGSKNRVRFDFASTYLGEYGSGPEELLEELSHYDLHSEVDLEFAVVIYGGEGWGRADVFHGQELLDRVSGDRDYYGADVEAYLASYHGLDVDAMPDSHPPLPDEIPLPESYSDDREPLSERVE